MKLFKLPAATEVNRVIPKNAFDKFTTARQKKLFTDLVSRITWTHKLAPDTINLEAKEIQEVQVFYIELKKREDIRLILDIIDKVIPYHIVFAINYECECYLSASAKHTHPTIEQASVIDCRFQSAWFDPAVENRPSFLLKKSLDAVFSDLCDQLAGRPVIKGKTLNKLIDYKTKTDLLEKEINGLRSKINTVKQFKEKVELNVLLQKKIKELKELKQQKNF